MFTRMNRFYYFGKLHVDGEFIGSAPSVLKDFLDPWAIELNKKQQSLPVWQEQILFTVPDANCRDFFAGVFWNSEDSKSRKYPFMLYWKILNEEYGHFPVARFNKDSFVEILQELWQFLVNVRLGNLQHRLARDARIAAFSGNAIVSIESPEASIPLEKDEEGAHMKWFSSAKKEWQKTMLEFAVGDLSERVKLHLTDAEPPWFLAYDEGITFHSFIQKKLHKG